MTEAPRPSNIRLRKQSRVLELDYADEHSDGQAGVQTFSLSWEYLRVYSPSAEVRGHNPSQAVLQTGKREVGVTALKPVGHYALQIIFDDGHDSGLYSWEYLYRLGSEQPRLWQAYLDDLAEAGASRDPHTQVLHFDP
jgi:DUF971 family protein